MKTLPFLVFFLLCNLSFSQVQIGQDLNGFLEDDDFGYSVSISDDGKTVAIGAPSTIIGQEPGYVQIFGREGGGWVQMGSDIVGRLPNNNAGARVALSGNGARLLLGAVYNNNGTESGAALVYEYDGNDWEQLGNDIGAVSQPTSVGNSVAISENGNVIAITTSLVTSINDVTGFVDVYEWQNNAWRKRGNTFQPTETFDLYGYGIDLSADGNIIAIGAENGVSPVTDKPNGFAQVYEWKNGQWIQMGDDLIGPYDPGSFGRDVSLSADGKRVLVSGPVNIGSLIFTGIVHVYDYENDQWNLVGNELIGGERFDRFGEHAELTNDGSAFIYSAFNENDNKGCAALYKLVANEWQPSGDKICGDEERDQFGYSVDISGDGNTAVVGARVNENEEIRSGYARVFDYSDNTSNVEYFTEKLELYPNPVSDRLFIDQSKIQNAKLRIFNVQQQLIHQQNRFRNEPMDVSGFQAGVYFVELRSDRELYVGKFLKN